MADMLLYLHCDCVIGLIWPHSFIAHDPELKLRMSQGYNCQCALCKDHGKISNWFALHCNIKMKSRVANSDQYNFHKIGFLQGMIIPHIVIPHTKRDRIDRYVQPSNRKWAIAIGVFSGNGYNVPPLLRVKG